MTTANAASAADTTTGTEGTGGADDTNLQQRVETESLLTDQDGDEAVDSTEVENAMLQGFARASGTKREDTNGDTNTDPSKANGEKQDTETLNDDGATTTQQQQPDASQDDPEVPGLGMKASEVKAQLAQLAALQKGIASANGHIGQLRQMLQAAPKGKAITKESLAKVREEFGDDYAEALAADLTAAGIGGGAAVDEEALGRIVNERMAAEREALSQDFEKKLVRQRHSDAADYFQGGKNNAEFLQFVGTLSKERQEELANSWDSSVINTALDEFKAQRQKVANDQTRQQRRTERSAAPTTGRGGVTAPPAVDPIEAGWNNVKGRGRGNAVGARR